MSDSFTIHHYDVGEIWSDRELTDEELASIKGRYRGMLERAFTPKTIVDPLPGLGGESWVKERFEK